MKMMKLGYVAWFDHSSGEGMICCPSDKSQYYVHWSAISEGKRPDKTLVKNQPVEFELYENLYMKQISKVSLLKFNYTVKNEHKLSQLMNEAWENSDVIAFELADQYYRDDSRN